MTHTSRLSLRLLSAILLCSTILTLVATSIQLFIDFRNDVDGIHQRIHIIEESYLDSLAASAFALDTPQLTLQLQGILKLPDIDYLELVEIENGTARILGTEGDPQSSHDIFHEFQLPYPDINNTSGVLRVSASFDGVYEKLWDTMFIILISNSIKTFTASFFIFLIIHHIVIRHLRTITDYAENVGSQKLNKQSSDTLKLTLNRKETVYADDLDRVCSSINDMQDRLISSDEERERIYRIFEATSDIVSIATPDGTLVYVNQAGKHITNEKSPVGHHISEFFPEHDFAIINDTGIPHAIKNGSWQGDSTLLRGDGTTAPISIMIMAHTNDAGELEYLSSIIRDVSEQRETEQRLRHSEKMDSIGQLTGGIAHDFNNMLGGIMGGADLLRTVIDDQDERGNRYINLIMQSAERAAELTSKMLTFARKSSFHQSNIDVHNLIDDALALLERSLDKSFVIHSDLTAESHTVLGDATGLINIIINLCINASHAMPHGGDIHIVSKNIALDSQQCRGGLSDLDPGEHILLTVSDNGCGMDSETLKHIYEPFFTTKEVGKGTGLGLSAVYGSVHDMRGAIDVSSTPELGTCFSIYFPLYTAPQHTEIPKNSSDSHNKKARILIVDDEEVIRVMTSMSIIELGHQQICAHSGKDAVQIYTEQHNMIDCIILDLIMPGMNGLETYLQLKEINPEIKVIISSGYSSNISLDDLRTAGVQHFLSKPYGYQELQDTIEDILSRT